MVGFWRLLLSYWGMVIVYIGFVIIVVGIIMIFSYDVECDVRMLVGDEVEIGLYLFVFDGIEEVEGFNYVVIWGLVVVSKGGKVVVFLILEKCYYYVCRDVMIEVVIDVGFSCDLYVVLGEFLGDGSWVICIYFKFFMCWVWGGVMIMVLGGFIVLSDCRYCIKLISKVRGVVLGLLGGYS